MTDNGAIYLADVIGADPETDLALIKVSAGTNFPYVRLARDPPRIGDWVLPIPLVIRLDWRFCHSGYSFRAGARHRRGSIR